MNERDNRRTFLTIAGAGVLLAACRGGERATSSEGPASSATTSSVQTTKGKDDDEDVSATEDLMREHGVIRRVLVVYRESAARLRAKPASVPADALQKAAKLMRTFAEDYHEKRLEEDNIFPVLVKRGGALEDAVRTLTAQHQRGREITEYVLAVTQKTVGAHAAEPLARTLEAFARMYEGHAALEDTIVFPAWKKAIGHKELDEMGDRFEEIEKKTFGKDGFDDAVDQIGGVEKMLGIELSGLTAPPPPKP